MENKPRSLAVCSSRLGYPQIWLLGAWFSTWGFEIGDQTEIINPEPGMMVIKVKTPAAIMCKIKKKRRIEGDIQRLKELNMMSLRQIKELKELEAELQEWQEEWKNAA